MIIFTKNPKKVFFFFFEKEIPRKIKIKIDNLVRVYYLWAPESRQISHTFNVFVFSVAKGLVAYSIIIRTFLCSKPFSFSSTWPLYYRQLALWLRAFFVSSFLIFFSNLFCTSSSFYINMCLHFHTHHSQFLMLCVIQSLL